MTHLKENKDPAFSKSALEALVDAWSIVDSIHRLRELLRQMPNLKRSRFNRLKVFLRSTSGFTELRNAIQHMRREISTMPGKRQAVWGTLSWLALLDWDGKLCRTCAVMYGALPKSEVFPMPVAGIMTRPIDQVTLTHQGRSVALSGAVSDVERLAHEFESAVGRSLERTVGPDTKAWTILWLGATP